MCREKEREQCVQGSLPLLRQVYVPATIIIDPVLSSAFKLTPWLIIIISIIIIIVIIIIYPVTARVVGAPQMISQPVFCIFPLFSTALRDLANSRPVHYLMLSSHRFFCLPCLPPPFNVPCKMVLAGPDGLRRVHTTSVCVSLRWSGGLRLVGLPAGSCHGLRRW